MAMILPSWNVAGVVAEKRELKTGKGDTWAYSVKVMALGGTFETTTRDKSLWAAVPEGAEIIATGKFEEYQGNLKLVLTSWKPSTGIVNAPGKAA